MKKKNLLILVSVIFAMVLMVACGPSKGLVGTWVGASSNGYTYTLVLNSNNTYTETSSSGLTYSGTWSATGNTLTFNETTPSQHSFTLNYSLSGNTLTLYDGGESLVYTRH